MPFSPTTVSSPSGNLLIKSYAHAILAACMIFSSSDLSETKAILSLIVPESKKLPCGTYENILLIFLSIKIFSPSERLKYISPLSGVITASKSFVRVLLPIPEIPASRAKSPFSRIRLVFSSTFSLP